VFDSVYPHAVQDVSARYWTPVSVALTGAAWLRDAGADSTLDVGSGAGKFCIVAALARNLEIQGVEQRATLIESAEHAARAYRATTAFHHTTIQNVDPRRFTAFYFYNPFGENQYPSEDRFDDLVELSSTRALRDVTHAECWLDTAPAGTLALTYHGFGGRVPDTYALLKELQCRGGPLRLWQKQDSARASGFLLELDDIVLSSEQLERMRPRLSPLYQTRLRELLDRPFGVSSDAGGCTP
jgi:hypothetical protein